MFSSDKDWPAVEQNLQRARENWGQLANILGREGADRRMSGKFYVVVVQAVLLFGSKTGVLTLFRHQAVRLKAGMVPKRQRDGTWVYTPIGEALEMLGLDEIRVYISRLQNTVTQYIATRPIIDLFLAAERNPGLRLSRRWR